MPTAAAASSSASSSAATTATDLIKIFAVGPSAYN